MRTSKFLAVAFTTALAGIAVAKPVTKPAPAPALDPDADSMSITMISSKGRLGVGVIQISPELRSHLGAPADRGVLVDMVKADSPAAKAGVRVGDVMVEVDGEAATSAMDMLSAMSDRKQGEAVAIGVVRDGKRADLTATLTEDAGPAMQRQSRSFNFGQMDPRFQQWFDASGMGAMDAFAPFGPGRDRALQQRVDELEQRLRKLEQKKYH
ncbi:MAG TPA: PDZ domain-containing protein [Kofleriaceae bacterium]|jgi:C-terminal processing protease CtpA/Prc|nr:PDZ domain-containing protein [Kofleriaceae bacterium]